MRIKTKDWEVEFTKEELADEAFMKLVEEKVLPEKRKSIASDIFGLLGL